MYHHPSTSSSSPPRQPNEPQESLTRFASAPGSFLSRAVTSVVDGRPGGGPAGSPTSSHVALSHRPSHYYQYLGADSSSLTSDSCKISPSGPNNQLKPARGGVLRFLEMGHCEPPLVRQKSSPAGFLTHLVSENGFSITRGSGAYDSSNGSGSGNGIGRLKSPLSFTRQDSLSQISEESESGLDGITSENRRQSSHTYSFGVQPWDLGSSIAFSAKRGKSLEGDFYSALDNQYNIPATNLEISSMDKLLNIPEDSVPCKVRAKRGFATHPRSIAERERRTRISGKLKKLQELVPNMDKQTSYADMLELAVQHIKGLQNEVQRLHRDLENCTCGCKPTT